ncbi:ABC transporter ATP-binding protein [Marinobacter zhejiangensis]|uniref:NitT/TauT family transport system ATP-binding protein n=1 Tax=Marinobacter zhejiangensis TaxID=488535 RepID=A0A1I4SH84_9GAMM|nr:ATP-binding cassette domain-containing protein [Marinobacter zhejiangensis]SFM63663.1 NitT/TauT family transport system ATP-binding protein [Marinobacter zhejiangensis]
MLELSFDGRGFRQPVLGAIHLRIERGDRVCLLGPSGVGKTTLLNILAGLDPVVLPSAFTQGSDLRVGYLFQEPRLLPWRTLYQNLVLVGAKREEAARLLSQVGLTGYGNHYPDQLSLGMARRAALARCLAVAPDLLLLDEPFASLDAERAGELQALITGLLDQNPAMAMVCVTHDEADAASLAAQRWWLEGAPARLRVEGGGESAGRRSTAAGPDSQNAGPLWAEARGGEGA